ncbi:MAG: nuclear transport factor 2 family protein [Gammaproteobacteria bacterium]|nr:nuclear transport factor 2 family protein [Gammaproteobacteria bacterium]
MTPTELLQTYYRAFNQQDLTLFLSTLSDDVVHDVNEGGRHHGKAPFEAFWATMARCYQEEIVDIEIMFNADQNRAAVEYRVLGKYLATDEGLPEANGQTYDLPGGAFFEIQDGHITRISNYYNLNAWLQQIA